jgi:hypothetical protein
VPPVIPSSPWSHRHACATPTISPLSSNAIVLSPHHPRTSLTSASIPSCPCHLKPHSRCQRLPNLFVVLRTLPSPTVALPSLKRHTLISPIILLRPISPLSAPVTLSSPLPRPHHHTRTTRLCMLSPATLPYSTASSSLPLIHFISR